MLNIHHIMCNMFQENCYVVSDETKECVIIDCGAFFEKDKSALTQYIADNQLTPRRLLATHGHVDHNLGNAFVFATYGLRPEMHEDDIARPKAWPLQAIRFSEGRSAGLTCLAEACLR